MKYNSAIRVKNSSQKAKLFFLEPWGEEFQIEAGKTFEVIAWAEAQGHFEIESGEDEIIVCAWSGSTVKVFLRWRRNRSFHR